MKKLPVAVFLLIMMLLSSCAHAEEEAPALLSPVGVALDTAVCVCDDLRDTLLIDGCVVCDALPVSFDADGTVCELFLYPGQSVRKGEVLARLDTTRLAEAAASYEESLAVLLSEDAYCTEIDSLTAQYIEADIARLRSHGASSREISLRQLDLEEHNIKSETESKLRAIAIEEMQKAFEEASAKLENDSLTAPCDGDILTVSSLYEGSPVQAGKPVAYISDRSRIFITTDHIAASELADTRITAQIGDMLYELVPVEYSQSDIAAKILNGETLKTEYTFADRNAAASVSVGDYAAVYIEKAVYENVLVIPNGALYHTSAGDYVYLAGEDGNRKKAAVVCGFSDGVSTEIRDGISEGDVVYVRN